MGARHLVPLMSWHKTLHPNYLIIKLRIQSIPGTDSANVLRGHQLVFVNILNKVERTPKNYPPPPRILHR